MVLLTYRRAVLIALCILAFFYFFRSPGSSQSSRIYNRPRPSQPGSHSSHPPHPPPTEPHVSHPEKQVSFADLANKPLRTQLEYYFPYDREEKFPAYIWQTWKYTPAQGEFSDDYRVFEASWSELHPGFVHEVITDESALHLLRHLYSAIPTVMEAYEALPLPILKADFFRYLILLARGGIYTDIDTAALKSALDWVPQEVPRTSYGLVIGIEADPDREDWELWYSRRIQFCQWTIQAKPGHPVLREIVALITEKTLKMRDANGFGEYDTHAVVEFTGPAAWTDTLFDYFNNPAYFEMDSSTVKVSYKDFTGIKEAKKVGDVVILPITCFSPGVGQMGSGEDDDPMAFVKHQFEGSWKPESERHIGEQEPENEGGEQKQDEQKKEEQKQEQKQEEPKQEEQKQEEQKQEEQKQEEQKQEEQKQEEQKQEEQKQEEPKEEHREEKQETPQEEKHEEKPEEKQEEQREAPQQDDHDKDKPDEKKDDHEPDGQAHRDDNTRADQSPQNYDDHDEQGKQT